VTDIFVRDLDTGSVELVSVSSAGAIANGNSEYPALSADGRYVVFGSSATNLVTLDENGSAQDIYRHDRQTGVTELVSHGVDGRQGDGACLFPDVSGDGRYVLFTYEMPGAGGGDGPSRRDVFVRDTKTGVTELVSEAMSGGAGNASSMEGTISANGRFLAFSSAASDLVPGDTNGILDVFVRDLLILKTERVTVSTGGAQSDAAGYAHYVSPGVRHLRKRILDLDHRGRERFVRRLPPRPSPRRHRASEPHGHRGGGQPVQHGRVRQSRHALYRLLEPRVEPHAG
jgi:Tol biopolymer transport system component